MAGYSYPHRPTLMIRDEPNTEHRCAKCYGPYGKSGIRCVNEPASTKERAQAWLDKRAEIREGN